MTKVLKFFAMLKKELYGRISPVVAFSVIFLCHPTHAGQAADSTALANDRVDSLFKQWNSPTSPGCALGIIRNGQFILRCGYGMADMENHIPISSTTVFNIASLSKQFTAACIVLLSGRGLLDLDDDVRKYIPELPDYGYPITIRRLLNHTSGIRDYVQMMFLAGSRYESVVNTNDAIKVITRQKALNFKPGDEWLYSNSGYVLAGRIVEKITGTSLSAFERENIFEPLGMRNTTVADDQAKQVRDRAIGYSPRPGGGFQPIVSNWEDTGDGGVNTTVEDLLLWDRNFYDPKVGGPSMVQQLQTPDSLNDGTHLGYALGLGVGRYKGLKSVNHEGEWGGFRTELMRFPEQNFAVIILCNLSSMVPLRLAQQVADIYLSSEMAKAQRTTVEASSPETPVKMAPNELSQYAGFYRNPVDELVRQLKVVGGNLLYVRSPNSTAELTPIGKNRFRMMGVPVETEVLFTSSASHQPTAMKVITKNTKPIEFEAFIPVIPTAEQLKHYSGVYHSDELDVDFRLLSSDSVLFLRTTDPGNDKLRPTATDVFKLGDVGILRFMRDGSHAIQGFSFTFGKVRNIAFVRRR